MTLRVLFDGAQAGPKLEHGMKIAQERIGKSVSGTATDAQAEILSRGRQNIQSAGKFGARWTRAFHADISQVSEGVAISVFFQGIPYWRVFEFGATIRGKPLLWIPLSFATDAKKIRARDYPGGLFRVDRRSGAPLLLSRATREPKYFGKEQVRIPQKFHLRDIVKDVARRMKVFYSKHFRSNLGG